MLIEEPTQMIYFNIKKYDSKYHFCELSYDSIKIDLGCLNKEERQSLIESLEDAIYQLKN
jgi:hypothetical protein